MCHSPLSTLFFSPICSHPPNSPQFPQCVLLTGESIQHPPFTSFLVFLFFPSRPPSSSSWLPNAHALTFFSFFFFLLPRNLSILLSNSFNYLLPFSHLFPLYDCSLFFFPLCLDPLLYSIPLSLPLNHINALIVRLFFPALNCVRM